MPSHPPETSFYNDADNATLWRDVSRLLDDFLSPKHYALDQPETPRASSEERNERFGKVLADITKKLREFERAA